MSNVKVVSKNNKIRTGHIVYTKQIDLDKIKQDLFMEEKPTPPPIEYINKPITLKQGIKEVCRSYRKGVVVLTILAAGVGVLSITLHNIVSN